MHSTLFFCTDTSIIKKPRLQCSGRPANGRLTHSCLTLKEERERRERKRDGGHKKRSSLKAHAPQPFSTMHHQAFRPPSGAAKTANMETRHIFGKWWIQSSFWRHCGSIAERQMICELKPYDIFKVTSQLQNNNNRIQI
jgi:hypothetical protein